MITKTKIRVYCNKQLQCFALALLTTVSAMAVLPVAAFAQAELLDDRWHIAKSSNFTVFSQRSSRQTSQVVSELEIWRQVAAELIQGEAPFPPANVPNYVYLLSDKDALSYFYSGTEPAFFYGTPRANFIAFIPDDDSSKRAALHQYAHFLQKNFYDLRVPRWYEEGMASYLARIDIRRNAAELQRTSEQTHTAMGILNNELSMERFLYRDEALASPRLIQIANLKSETLLHFLLHGYQEDSFVDRRAELNNYLQLLFAGRNQRFAFDQAFSVTTRQLDEEFENYLAESRRPRGDLPVGNLIEPASIDIVEIAQADLALMLGELALNSGATESAEVFFKFVIDSQQALARAFSGLGDALRFSSPTGRDQEIARYFDSALEIAPDDPDILLDFGEYWESELQDCDKTYPEVQRQQIMLDIKQKFLRSLELRPDSAEAHLALAEYYLLAGQDWREGQSHQAQAFELLPADGFILEASAKYAIAADEFEQAQRLINEMAQPIHFFGEPEYVRTLRQKLDSKQRGEVFDECTPSP